MNRSTATLEAERKIVAPPIIVVADKKSKITVKGVIIDIVSVPVFFVFFVLANLYAGISFLFRIK